MNTSRVRFAILATGVLLLSALYHATFSSFVIYTQSERVACTHLEKIFEAGSEEEMKKVAATLSTETESLVLQNFDRYEDSNRRCAPIEGFYFKCLLIAGATVLAIYSVGKNSDGRAS